MTSATVAEAAEAPPGMNQFNVSCPALRLCPILSDAYLGCLRGVSDSCATFVDAYWEATPVYDCQRPFDVTPTAKYVVPAIWLCGPQEGDDYVRLLHRLKTLQAQRLFASPKFRSTLDGYLAEEFHDKSLQLERRLKRNEKRH